MKTATRILREAGRKRAELRLTSYWSEQIPERCPPVLWFGDHSLGDKIVTVGLNPSFGEFFKNQDDARISRYLESSEKRFYVYTLEDLGKLEDPTVTNNVLQSYDSYFQMNPYTRWFGRPGGYNVELFINQFDASFYGDESIGCVHIDLFPFVTVEKFSDLDRKKVEEAFNDGWFQEHLKELIDFLKPQCIVLFGRSTVDLLNQYYDGDIELDREFKHNKKKFAMYGMSVYTVYGNNIPIVGLSVNLGNPRGFTKVLLRQLGTQIVHSLKSDTIETWKTLPFLRLQVSNELLDIALQHEENQELAVLGDAVLKVAIREYFYDKGKDAETIQGKDETFGTDSYLAKISSEKLNLHKYIISKSGLRNNPDINEVYARTLEAIIGAIFKENGIQPVKKFIERWIIPRNS